MPLLNLSPSAILMRWYVLLWGAMAISPADSLADRAQHPRALDDSSGRFVDSFRACAAVLGSQNGAGTRSESTAGLHGQRA